MTGESFTLRKMRWLRSHREFFANKLNVGIRETILVTVLKNNSIVFKRRAKPAARIARGNCGTDRKSLHTISARLFCRALKKEYFSRVSIIT